LYQQFSKIFSVSLALLTALTLSAQTGTSDKSSTPAKTLSVESIYSPGGYIGRLPNGLRWSPDSKHLTFIQKGELAEIDLTTGKPRTFVSEEKLADLQKSNISEKDKDHRARYAMADYIWSPDSTKLLFDSNGQLAIYDVSMQSATLIGQAADSGDDPQFAPNGKFVAFIRDHGLVVVALDDKKIEPKSIAPAPNANILNGEVDWVYAEELDVRSNYAWSPDSASIAYLEMNEEKVPSYPITDWIPTHAAVDEQRFPQPGDPNPAVRVGVVGVNGGLTRFVNLPIRANEDYISRFGWVNAKTLWIEALTRDHKHMNLYFADAATGESHLVLERSDDKFMDDNYDVKLEDGNIFVTGWQDGHNHIYRYSYDQANPTTVQLVAQLTKGDFDVESTLLGSQAGLLVDEKHSTVTYSSNEGDPISTQIWQVDFKGKRHALTTTAGTHHANFSPDGAHYVENYSSLANLGTVSLCTTPATTTAGGGSCTQLWANPSMESVHLRAPQIIKTTAHDGKTVLYSTLLLPEGATKAASVPLILNPYGGPGPQTVVNGGGVSPFDELLTRHGFAVLHTDNRGTGHRGRDFAQAAYHNFGAVQFEDQMTVMDSVLAQFPVLDKNRLGWWGWSWGGTFTLYAMSHSDRFRAGVSVAPVTDYRNYDSIYTERYMSLPSDFAKAYDEFAVTNSAANLHGHILIAHGTGDDNVHIENTVQYVQKLIEAQKSYDLQIYPRKTHSIAGQDVRTSLFNRILEQFDTYLMPVVDPMPATGNTTVSTPTAGTRGK
jgi:dipeptidyl-peptidase 4